MQLDFSHYQRLHSLALHWHRTLILQRASTMDVSIVDTLHCGMLEDVCCNRQMERVLVILNRLFQSHCTIIFCLLTQITYCSQVTDGNKLQVTSCYQGTFSSRNTLMGTKCTPKTTSHEFCKVNILFLN